MLCASRSFERQSVPIYTAVDPHESRDKACAPACSASNLSRLKLTRVDVLWFMNVNGAGSEAIKTQRQDVVLPPAHAIQMPAAAVIWRLRNVDVFA